MIKFNSDHKLKIMQITDIQEIPKISPDTLNLLNSALDREKPDLVVLTGDQIKGYGITYKNKNSVAVTIKAIMEPITSRGIPFAVTFGNHDRQVGISNKEQMEKIYNALPGCVCSDKAFDAGTYCVPICSSDGKNTVFCIYLFDSGTDKRGGGYEAVSRDQMEWYRRTRNEMHVPSIVFQHIPLCEYYCLLKKVNRFTPKRIRAYRTHENEFYTLADSSSGNFLEPPSIPDENTGEFDVLCEKGDVLAIFVGHDHKNDFVGKYKGVTMGFTPSSGFNEYGNGMNRGVRIIELDERNMDHFTTRVVTYKDLGYTVLHKPVKDFIYRHSPATMDAAKILIRYILTVLAAVSVGIAALKFLF